MAAAGAVATLALLAAHAGCGSTSSSAGRPGPDGGDVAPPRPVAPVSVSYATSRRPALRWELAPGTDGARIEMCLDRACTRVVTTFDASGGAGSPPQDLPAGAVFWRAYGKIGSAVGVTASATWELVAPAQSGPLALAWGAMMDANGDGYGDVVVGDSDTFSASQHVYVHLGGPSGPSPGPSSILSAPAPVVHYAASIASAGDVDGDGFPELLVGSPNESTVYVYGGGPAGYAEPPALVLHGASMTSFGAAVAGAGDVDGDGYADIVVGAGDATPGDGAVEGEAVVYFGGAGGLAPSRSVVLPYAGTSDEMGVGDFVSSAGDMNGDGFADVAVYGGLGLDDPQNIAVYLGAAKGFGTGQPIMLQYEAANTTWIGNANLLACAGDVNGDGYTDLAIASASPPNSAFEADHVTLFFGSASGPSLVPSRLIVSALSGQDHFGMSVVGRDFDGDGTSDVGVATISYATPPVAAQIYEGGMFGPNLVETLTTQDPTLLYEREVGATDVDGDGYADLLVGFPSRQTGNPDAGGGSGAVEVHGGGPKGVALEATYTLLPPADGGAVAYGASLPP